MKTCSAAVAAAALLLAVPASADDCDYTAARHAVIQTAGATAVRVIGRAGTLDIQGQKGLHEVRAKGRACTSARSDLDAIQLKATREGSEILIEAVMPENPGRSGFWFFGLSSYQRLDMTVIVPDHLPLRVTDGSGALSVSGVASLKLNDGSGAIRVENVTGDVRITDGSGAMRVTRVGGTVTVTDGSGDIEIANVERDVIIESDGSGSIGIRAVRGSVRVDADGSGSIDVTDVGGDFIVRHDGSGGITHRGVAGKVRLPRDGD
jgi:hypothetical protein